MKRGFALAVIVAAFIFSCKNKTGSVVKTMHSEAAKQGFYFNYTLDGREMRTDATDIFSNYYPYKNLAYSLFAGKEDSIIITLTVYQDMRKTSVTPSVATDPNTNTFAGTVSVQNYPENNITLTSYQSSLPDSTPVSKEAIIITGSEKEEDTARIISGIFHAKLYIDNADTRIKNKEHFIKGKFRIRHEFHSYNGGQF